MKADLFIKTVNWFDDGKIYRNVAVKDERVAAVLNRDQEVEATQTIDAQGSMFFQEYGTPLPFQGTRLTVKRILNRDRSVRQRVESPLSLTRRITILRRQP
jgi:hypothetical protein